VAKHSSKPNLKKPVLPRVALENKGDINKSESLTIEIEPTDWDDPRNHTNYHKTLECDLVCASE
jgi:hypothetical protein